MSDSDRTDNEHILNLARAIGLETADTRKPSMNKVRYPYKTLCVVTDPVRASALLGALERQQGILDVWVDDSSQCDVDALESKLRAATGGVWLLMPSATDARKEICHFGDAGAVIVSSDEDPEIDPETHALKNAAAVVAAVNNGRAMLQEIKRLRAELARRGALEASTADASGEQRVSR